MSHGTKLPEVSFIVPNYNYGHYLGECLESAVSQTYTDWEIIIIDDTSNDNSREVAREFIGRYPDKIRLIELRGGPGGPPRAVNTGIRAMRGQYFSWLSSDDRCHPERLAKLVSALENSNSAGMVHTAYRLIDSDGRPGAVTVPDNVPGTESFFRLLQGNLINGSTVLVRKELLDEIGPLLETHPEVPDLLRVSEYILWLEIAMRSDVALVNEPLHDYRIHQLNSEYNGSTLGKTLVRIAKQYFLKKHGLKKVVSLISARSGCSRAESYGRIASILMQDPYSEHVSLFVEALANEGEAEAAAVQQVVHDLQRRENERQIVEFYLTTNNTVTRHVFQAFTGPSPDLERLTLKLLNAAKAEYRSGNTAKAANELRNLLLVTRFFPSLDVSARYYLGLALEQLRHHDAAQEQFEAVLRLDPSHREAALRVERHIAVL